MSCNKSGKDLLIFLLFGCLRALGGGVKKLPNFSKTSSVALPQCLKCVRTMFQLAVHKFQENSLALVISLYINASKKKCIHVHVCPHVIEM